jgi:hypothetical protein
MEDEMTVLFGDPRMPERFWNKVDVNYETGCWEWTGSRNENGYGLYVVSSKPKKQQGAHRAAFMALRFDPEELVCDHLCRVRHCVNPNHIRAVTSKENILAGVGFSAINARKTHCPSGHEYTPENTYRRPRGNKRSGRDCRACEAAKPNRPGGSGTYSGVNSEHGTPGKYRSGCRCRECKDQQRDRMRAYRAARHAA